MTTKSLDFTSPWLAINPTTAFSLNDFEFASSEPMESSSGYLALRFKAAPVEINLPESSSSVTLRVSSGNGVLDIAARDRSGSIIDTTSLPTSAPPTDLTLKGDGIYSLTLLSPGREGQLHIISAELDV